MNRGSRTSAFLVATIMVGSLALVSPTAAAPRGRCTVEGTAADDPIIDTGGANVICARRGNDAVEAGAENDLVRGAGGTDRLEGNDGSDVVRGGRGPDTIVVTDGVGGNDRAVGGRGEDTCVIDRGDRARACENTVTVG